MYSAIVFFLGVFAYYFYYNFVKKRKNLPPGPAPLPLLGNLLHLDLAAPDRSVAKIAKKYGGIFTFWVGGTPMIMITDTQLMNETFVKQGEVFTDRSENIAFDTLSRKLGISNRCFSRFSFVNYRAMPFFLLPRLPSLPERQ